MPNHITNILTIKPTTEDVAEHPSIINNILEAIKKDNADEENDSFLYGAATIDFNKIIPMPKSLNIEAGTSSKEALEMFENFLEDCEKSHFSTEKYDPANDTENNAVYKALIKKHISLCPGGEKAFELGRKVYLNVREYGAPTWYEWCIKNWGTKWNAYQEIYSNGILEFQTAWATPQPIIEKLSEIYKDVIFFIRWSDEDFGYNTGEMEFLNGEIISDNAPDGGSKEAYEMAAEIMGVELNKPSSGYYLSADESTYIWLDSDEEYELVELFGKPALFNNGRMDRSQIPKGLYCYDLRTYDDGRPGFASVENLVNVNHGGNILTNSPVDFSELGYIEFTEETSPNFLGQKMSIPQFLSGELETSEDVSE